MFHHLLYPTTLRGKMLHSSLICYLCISLIGCTTPQQPTVKPPATVARAMETRSFSKDMKTVLKASINALQDMDYTIDVLNSDVGLITASRTSEQLQTKLSHDNPKKNNQSSGLGNLIPIVFIAGAAIILLNLIFDNDDDDHDKRRDREGPTINIGSGEPQLVKNVVEKIRKILKKGKPQYGKIKFRKGENIKLYPIIKKAKQKLKWRPKTKFNTGLKITINSFKK